MQGVNIFGCHIKTSVIKSVIKRPVAWYFYSFLKDQGCKTSLEEFKCKCERFFSSMRDECFLSFKGTPGQRKSHFEDVNDVFQREDGSVLVEFGVVDLTHLCGWNMSKKCIIYDFFGRL